MTDLSSRKKYTSESIEKDQKLRLKRFKISMWTYLFVFVVTLLISFLSNFKVDFYLWITLLITAVTGNLVFYFVFVTNFNLRFHDKSLTREQILYAGLWAVFAAYLVPEYRPFVLMYFLPAFSFGMLRLNLKQYLMVVTFFMIFYLVMLIFEYKLGKRDFDLIYESYLFVVFGTILIWFACFGGMVSNLRDSLRKNNREIKAAYNKLESERGEKEKVYNIISTALEQIPMGIIIVDAKDMKISFSNHYKLENDYKIGEDQDLNTEDYNIYHKDGITPMLFSDRPLVRSIKEGLKIRDEEIVIEYKNGVKNTILVSSAPLYDTNGEITSGISVFNNITDKKVYEGKLEQAQERFTAVLNGIDATIYVSDINTNEILFMNKHMVEVFGRDMTGEKCFTAFTEDGKKCEFCQNNKLLDENGKPKGVISWQRKNSFNGRWYNNYDRAIEWTDGRIVKIQIATDITDYKNMEADLRHAQKMESVVTLAGGIAHDFNNILSIIIGNTDLAMGDIDPDNRSVENLMEIKSACMRAKNSVAQLLNFSRKKEDDKKIINIGEVLKDSIGFIKKSFPPDIKIRSEIPEEEILIYADFSQMHQSMINLCTNSSQAMGDEDGGNIDIVLELINIREGNDIYNDAPPGKYAKIVVSDTGKGMDNKTRDKIFDPYFTTKDVGEGMGMGLSVVHGIIKNHNGYIYTDGEEKKGTSITILLPLTEKDNGKKGDGMEEKAKGTERILFVDDEEALVKMGERALSLMGYQVKGFTDPERALEEYKENPESFDVVVTDMTMPQINGVEFSEKLNSIRKIPIIICTGYSANLDETKAKEIGIAGFAMKPVTMGDVAKKIRKIFEA